MSWMIYGATGYTGRLVAEEAVRRGHRPLLAGRSASRLKPLAEQLGLDWVAVSFDDIDGLRQAVARVDVVYHAAGPFIHTSALMQRACLAEGTNYIDITGELDVFRQTYKQHDAACQRGIVLVSGAGFDVVPSDCLANYVAMQVPHAVDLEIALAVVTRASAGTTKSMLEMLPEGGKVRRNGWLVAQPLGSGAKVVRFSNGERTVIPIPWGDLETAYRSTGIPNITTYMAYPRRSIGLLRTVGPIAQRFLSSYAVRRVTQILIDRWIEGPDETLRQSGRAYLWARAADAQGNAAEAWLETAEAYRFTALAGVRAVETVLEQRPVGALTPAQAFGVDWMLEIEGTKRIVRDDTTG